MALEKDSPRQNEREDTDLTRHAGPDRTDEPRRDSGLASEYQADFNRDAERAEARQGENSLPS
jgi:hypothetical protein